MATIGSAKATLVNKIDSLTSSATAKDTIFLAKALKENSSLNNFVWQGPWTNSTAYYVDDVVTNSGNTYMCILAYTSAASPGAFAVGSNWSIMAEKGSTVGVGTAGQVLKTKSDLSGTEWGADEGGKVKGIYNRVDTTRVSVADSSQQDFIYITFTKAEAATKLLIQSIICGFGTNNGAGDWGYRLDGGGLILDVLGGQHTYTGNGYAQTSNIHGVIAGVSVGSHTLYITYAKRNSAGRPWSVTNPNSTESGEYSSQGISSSISVIEYE